MSTFDVRVYPQKAENEEGAKKIEAFLRWWVEVSMSQEFTLPIETKTTSCDNKGLGTKHIWRSAGVVSQKSKNILVLFCENCGDIKKEAI